MLVRRSLLVFAFAATAASAATASCSESTPSGSFGSAGGYKYEPEGGGDESVLSSSTSSFGVAPIVQGNPLCNAIVQSPCYPDTTTDQCEVLADAAWPTSDSSGDAAGSADAHGDDAAETDADDATDAAATPVADGAADAGADAARSSPFGCRVVESADAGVAPVCTAAGSGIDGDHCSGSKDCAAGYECVGDGICRRYCCSGSCDATHFCDVQLEAHPAGAGVPVPVPVCVPVVPCALPGEPSDAGSCVEGSETCAVVLAGSISGAVPVASCVQSGPASVGESCEAQHCAAGLTCIGAWGNKICYTLCDTTDASSQCQGSQVCSGGLPLFPDPLTGICKQPVAADF
jgi:hypothetical protein